MRRQERAEVVGTALLAVDGRRIGRVEAAFVDYYLVRTGGLMPIDLYVPRPSAVEDGERLRVDCTRSEARARWHRPLKRAPHD